MAEFLTTLGAADRLERLVTQARQRLVLISPFLQVSPILLERLQEAERRGVVLTVVYGKAEMKAEERRQLARLDRLTLRYLANLHAKCYASEAGMVITSMNLYQFSERNNREMGVFLAAGEPAYLDAWREIESILAAAQPERTPTPSHQPAARAEVATSPFVAPRRSAIAGGRGERAAPARERGYCIRCRRGIPLDRAKPFCIDCFRVWAQWENGEFPERWCHDCGDDEGTTAARPLCTPCFVGAARP